MKKKIGDLSDGEKHDFCKNQTLCSYCVGFVKENQTCKVFSISGKYKEEEIEVQE